MTTPRPGPFRIDRSSDGTRLLPDGVTEWDLRTSRYRRLFPGVFVRASVHVTPWVLATGAVLMVGPTAVISHHTAAQLWGGSVPDDGHTHVTLIGKRHQVRGMKTHRSKPGQRARILDGLDLTSAAQTFPDLAADLNLVDLVVLGDSLVRAGRVVIVRSKDVYRSPARTLSRIRSAMRDVGMPVPGLSEERRHHLPSRPGDRAFPG